VKLASALMLVNQRSVLAKALEPIGGWLAGSGSTIFGGAILIKNAPVEAYAASIILVAIGIWILASSFARR
jgi:hypothetical protein